MKDFVPHKESLQLEELGFDEYCFGAFTSDGVFKRDTSDWNKNSLKMINEATDADLKVLAPLYQQAFRFFRAHYPDLNFGVGKIYNHKYHYHINLEWRFYKGSYEEAELELLKELIEYAKTN